VNLWRVAGPGLPGRALARIACRAVTAVEPTALLPALPPLPAPVVVRTPWRVPVRILLWAGPALAFVTTCAVNGLPTDRVVLLGWALTGLVAHAAVDGWRRIVRLLAEWLPVAVLLLAYDATRGLADGLGMPVHVTEPAAFDRWLGAGVLPTVWLQQTLEADWWKAVAALVYGSHFVVTPLLLAVLWVRDRRLWGRYVRMVLALSAAGLATYVLYPAAPPWLAAKEGVVEPVRRLSATGWDVLGLPHAGALLADSQGQVNQVAAVPSLHTAFAVLTCLVLLPVARRTWQRVALVGYAVLMPLVLVWAGEHYVVDTLLGAGYAAVVVLALRLVGMRTRRADDAALPTVDA
jgi:hypothetical protein